MLQHESFENLLEKQNQNSAKDDLGMLLLRSLYQTLQLRRVPDLSCSELTLALASITNRLLTGRSDCPHVLIGLRHQARSVEVHPSISGQEEMLITELLTEIIDPIVIQECLQEQDSTVAEKAIVT